MAIFKHTKSLIQVISSVLNNIANSAWCQTFHGAGFVSNDWKFLNLAFTENSIQLSTVHTSRYIVMALIDCISL